MFHENREKGIYLYQPKGYKNVYEKMDACDIYSSTKRISGTQDHHLNAIHITKSNGANLC